MKPNEGDNGELGQRRRRTRREGAYISARARRERERDGRGRAACTGVRLSRISLSLSLSHTVSLITRFSHTADDDNNACTRSLRCMYISVVTDWLRYGCVLQIQTLLALLTGGIADPAAAASRRETELGAAVLAGGCCCCARARRERSGRLLLFPGQRQLLAQAHWSRERWRGVDTSPSLALPRIEARE